MLSSTSKNSFLYNVPSGQRYSTQLFDPSALIPAQHQRKSGFQLSLLSGTLNNGGSNMSAKPKSSNAGGLTLQLI
jgi:hypothetical protein